MSRSDLARWSFALALLLAPTVLRAQAPVPDPAKANAAKADAAKADAAKADAAKANAARKAREEAEAVICRDGTSGSNAQACAGHGGVDPVTTSASKTGRVDHGAGGAGGAEGRPAGRGGQPEDTIRIKSDAGQSDSGQADGGIPDGWGGGHDGGDGWGDPWGSGNNANGNAGDNDTPPEISGGVR
jgi:hypothetical protein